MRFTVASLIVATVSVGFFGTSLAGPIRKRSSGVSCSKDIYLTTNTLGYGNDITRRATESVSTGQRLGQHVSNGGQNQVTLLQDGAKELNVNIRFCNSTHLDIFGVTDGPSYRQDGTAYTSYGKIFLADDESKCLQRHAILPSSDPNAKTHIAIEDCSNVDDSIQARQFWSFETQYREANPLTKVNGKINLIPLALSNTTPKALLAANDGQAYQGLLF